MTPDAPRQARIGKRWFCPALIVGVAVIGVSQATGARAEDLQFDIPAQSLETALERYGEITGRDALYNGGLAAGLRSASVHGMFSPDDALATILNGTGLAAHAPTPSSFALLRMPNPPALSATLQAYYGRIQARLRTVLCADAATRPGHYRLAMRLWLDSAGRISKHERLGSTGGAEADGQVDKRLASLAIGAPPPLDLAQPVTIVIVPEASGVTMRCHD